MESGGEAVRRVAVIVAATVTLAAVAIQARGQESLGFLQPIIEFLAAEMEVDLEADLVRALGAGAVVTDPAFDFEHITGETPRFTPPYIDIRKGSIFEVDPGAAELFGPTNSAVLWSPTGPREIDPPDHASFHTYTTNRAKDGRQYQGGAVLFRISLREGPPPNPEGTCDYTVWGYDAARGAAFQNLPEFPADPAAGTNVAFGVRLTPEAGAVPVAYALELDEQGQFQPSDTDTRAFVIEENVGIFVPGERLGELASVNYHAVCSADRSAIEPSSSGADQSGLTSIALSDAAAVVIVETPVTATPTVATTTSSIATSTAATVEAVAEAAPGAAVWAPALAAAALLGAVAYWVFARRRNPEERALAAWRRSERVLTASEEEAAPLVIACLDARSALDELEQERADLCRVWPPACLEDDGESAGPAQHQHFRRMALGELWIDYKEGRLGADQVEARWREVNTPEFQARMRETNQAYRETLAQLDDEIAAARSAADVACAPAGSAAAKAETARQAALAAKVTYLETLEDPPPVLAAPWLVGGCDQAGARRLAADGPQEHLRVNVGFMLSVGRFVGRERVLERGERLVLEMEGILNEMGMVSDVNRVRQGGTHTGWTGHEYRPGVYWVTSEGIRQGETEEGLPPPEAAERPTRTADPSATLTDLPRIIGDHAASKVTGWLTGFETVTTQRTFFHQLLTVRPYTVWECRDRSWFQQEQVLRVEVGEPLRNRGQVRWFSVESPGQRAQFETEITRLAWVVTGVVTRDLRRLLRWRAGHTPEPQPRP